MVLQTRPVSAFQLVLGLGNTLRPSVSPGVREAQRALALPGNMAVTLHVPEGARRFSELQNRHMN